MRTAFATAAILVNSAFALTIKQDRPPAVESLQSHLIYPTNLAQVTADGDAIDISDYVSPNDDGTWQL